MKKEMLTAAALTLLLCGCSHKTEVRDKGFVRSIGCDGNENKTVSVRLYGEKDVLSGNGETIFTAIENAETSQGKTLFTGHLELLALSPGNIREMLTVMMQNNRISPSCSLLMIPENASGAIESYEETELTDLIESGGRKGKIKNKNISGVLNDLLEDDAMAAVPALSNNELTMAVIDSDSIVGILSEEESQGLCWLTGSLRDIYLPVEVGGRTISFQIRKSSPKLKAEFDGKNIKITTEIKISGGSIEEGISHEEASEAAAAKISGLCSKTISKTVTGMKADVLGIQKCISSENININGEWKELIPRLQFYYSIKIAS